MEYKLLGISGLILIILLLTWLKDGENMNPPLKRRAVIDMATIAIFWAVYEFYNYSQDKAFENEVAMIINLALLFFLARMVQLIAQLNPMMQEFVSFLKKKGVRIDEIDERK
ncbi:MAG: holin [Pseudolactococcus laudensis]